MQSIEKITKERKDQAEILNELEKKMKLRDI
jgi:hypothetical protein